MDLRIFLQQAGMAGDRADGQPGVAAQEQDARSLGLVSRLPVSPTGRHRGAHPLAMRAGARYRAGATHRTPGGWRCPPARSRPVCTARAGHWPHRWFGSCRTTSSTSAAAMRTSSRGATAGGGAWWTLWWDASSSVACPLTAEWAAAHPLQEPKVIDKILKHLRDKGRDARAHAVGDWVARGRRDGRGSVRVRRRAGSNG